MPDDGMIEEHLLGTCKNTIPGHDKPHRPDHCWNWVPIEQRIPKIVVEFTCEFCGDVQTTPGALIFGPPNDKSQCAKWHICDGCYGNAVPW